MKDEKLTDYLNELDYDMYTLGNCEFLCDSGAEDITIKYNLSGSIQDGIAKLKQLIDKYNTQETLTESDEEEIKNNREHLDKFLTEQRNDIFTNLIREAIKNGDERKVDILIKKKEILQQEMHKGKQCICFTKR